MTNIITVTEGRKIACSVCGYEPSGQGRYTAWEIIDDIQKHYNNTHKEVGDSLLSPSEKRLGTGHFKRCD